MQCVDSARRCDDQRHPAVANDVFQPGGNAAEDTFSVIRSVRRANAELCGKEHRSYEAQGLDDERSLGTD